MAICIAYLGVGVVAIPIGIISAGFVEQYQRKSNISDLKDMDINQNTLSVKMIFCDNPTKPWIFDRVSGHGFIL